ncbi:MAG TPA: hypothetical protein DCX53_08565, partial [Anaerolineae bacterium]|nr:hypothetical protein [Anaerolineae bacterium]
PTPTLTPALATATPFPQPTITLPPPTATPTITAEGSSLRGFNPGLSLGLLAIVIAIGGAIWWRFSRRNKVV